MGALDERYATPRLRRIVAKLLAHEAGEAPATAETLAIAEDDADGRPVLTLILEFAGAKVEAVATVRAALSALDGHRPDVLISDVGMPEKTGMRSSDISERVRWTAAARRRPSRSPGTSALMIALGCWPQAFSSSSESQWSRPT